MKNVKILSILLLLTILSSCQQSTPSQAPDVTKGMIKVTILYPNGEGKTFDMDYYVQKHMPMLANLLGDTLKKIAIDQGISGRTPEEPLPYLAIGYLYCESLSAYQSAFAPHAEKIRGDIPNYTNIKPLIQISEVVQ